MSREFCLLHRFMFDKMVEVFKTKVNDEDQARILLERIRMDFTDYKVNFDLDDCDKILRVESYNQPIEISILMETLRSYGIEIELLEDEVLFVRTGINQIQASVSGRG